MLGGARRCRWLRSAPRTADHGGRIGCIRRQRRVPTMRHKTGQRRGSRCNGARILNSLVVRLKRRAVNAAAPLSLRHLRCLLKRDHLVRGTALISMARRAASGTRRRHESAENHHNAHRSHSASVVRLAAYVNHASRHCHNRLMGIAVAVAITSRRNRFTEFS